MGKLALAGITPEGTPFRVWCDAMWATYADYIIAVDRDLAEHLESVWDELRKPPQRPARRRRGPAADGDSPRGGLTVPPWRAEGRKPTREEQMAWSGTAAAQRGQEALLEMSGYRPGSSGADTETAGE